MNRPRVVATVGAVGLALASCSWRITRRPLWIDEAFSLGATNQLVSTIRGTGGTMALYYAVLNGWTAVFGPSPLALRSLSVAFVLLALLVLSALVFRLLPAGEAALTLLVVALLPAMLRMGQDARAYPLVMALAIGCWLALDRAVEADAAGDRAAAVRWCLALVPLVVAGELAHGLFLLQVPALVLSVAVHLRHRRQLLLALAPAVVAGVATLAVLLLAFDAQKVGSWVPPLTRAQVGDLARTLLARRWGFRALLGGLLAVGVVAMVRRPAPDPVARWRAMAPVWWAFSPAILLIALSAVRPSLLGRYVSGSVPAIGLLIAVGLASLWRAIGPTRARAGSGGRAVLAGRAAIGLGVALAVVSVPILDRVPPRHPWFEDWDAVADYIGAHGRPGDGVAFLPIGGKQHNTDTLRAPFEAAWTGRSGPRVPLDAIGPTRPLGQVHRLEAPLDPADLSARAAAHERTWVVMVPTSWTALLDVQAREPARSTIRRARIVRFNGGMVVVLLARTP